MSNRGQDYRFKLFDHIWFIRPIRLYKGRRQRRRWDRRRDQPLLPAPLSSGGSSVSGKQVLGTLLALPVLSAGVWAAMFVAKLFRNALEFFGGNPLVLAVAVLAVLGSCLVGATLLRRRWRR